MQSSSTFIRLPGPIPEVKQIELINEYEIVIAYWEESEQSNVQENKSGILLKNTLGCFANP